MLPANPLPFSPTAAPAPPRDLATPLAEAARALWLATLSLMTVYMQTRAPAHRYLLARRISGNFTTLSAQPECFGKDACRSFEQLAQRWQQNAIACSPEAGPAGVGSRLMNALRRFGMSTR